MWSSMEMMGEWARDVLDVPVSTYPASGAGPTFALVSRTGGRVDYPHDSPEISVQVWSKSDSEAEEGAMAIGIAAKTLPPDDPHVNSVGAPNVYRYGAQDGGWFVWEADVPLETNIID